MENYKEKYEQALETARKINSGEGVAAPKGWNALEVIFPELRKNEEERIKTNIIKLLRFVRDTHHQYFDECNEAIDWFEKQYDFTPKSTMEAINEEKVDDANKVEPKFKVGDTIINTYYRWSGNRRIREIIDGKYIFDGGSYINIKEQDEWILCLKPKFKVGDWVVNKKGGIGKINEIKNDSYGTLRYYVKWVDGNQSDPMPCFVDDSYHLWTIRDTKGGDVLVDGSRVFIYREHDDSSIQYYASFYPKGKNKLLFDGAFFITSDIIKDIYPATKEQRDLLFQKIKEVGYEWDNNKKRINKVMSNENF